MNFASGVFHPGSVLGGGYDVNNTLQRSLLVLNTLIFIALAGEDSIIKSGDGVLESICVSPCVHGCVVLGLQVRV